VNGERVRKVFIVSDHTGITAEMMARSLLSQFPDYHFFETTLPFIDSPRKAADAAARIRSACADCTQPALVFSTLTDPHTREALMASGGCVLDIYAHFLGQIEQELGQTATPRAGRAHGVADPGHYHHRIDAVNFALSHDDGLGMERYERAQIVLLGVSRSGKTPTSLYLAMNDGLLVANYPITPEDFERGRLPARVLAQRKKLRGLTLEPERLALIREERRPGSRYAALDTCTREIMQAEQFMRANAITMFDTTSRSVEEIATLIKQTLPDWRSQ
jgi:regulator of PEP synthase PpsR (kinase-PPPase family)